MENENKEFVPCADGSANSNATESDTINLNPPGCSDFVEEVVDAKPVEEVVNKAPEDTVTPDIVKEAEKDLTELKEIGEEITKLENRLDAVPEPAQPQVDPKKYNRKQRRRMERQMKHQQKLETKQAEQKGNTFATRKDLVQMYQSLQKLRDRLYYVDVLTGALEKLLIEKGMVTEEEIADRIKKENAKAMAFQEIQKGTKDYDNRLKRCQELQIDPNISVIGQQIYEDPDLDISAKVELAQKYDLKILLQALGNLVSPKQEGASVASETSGDKGSE